MTARPGAPAPARGNDLLTNIALGGLAGMLVVAGVLRVAGILAATATGASHPKAGAAKSLTVLAHPTRPADALQADGLNPVAYWAAVALIVLVAATAGWFVWVLIRRGRSSTHHDPHQTPGTATARDVVTHAGTKTLLARAHTLRPSLAKPTPGDVGYLLGSCHGKQVWSSVEDSTLIIGPPRSGKGLHLVINAILDAPGSVISTSTRPDNLAATLTARARRGPVAVFDPQRIADGLPSGLRWSPVRGCADPLTAMIRATGLASATGLSGGGVESGGFWEGKTRAALQGLLHAAALADAGARELLSWSLSPATAGDAVAVLASHPGAAPGWAESLEAMTHADPRTRDSIWMGVSLALACLADPRVMDAVTPRAGEHFDPTDFLTRNGTLYLLATGAGAGAAWPLVAAFIEDLVETARHLAAHSPGSRLDPPLLLALDEIGNLAPLPSLPVLMAEGGGTGITTMPVLQSLSQARDTWGDHAAGAIWDASIVKVVFGGSSSARDLQDLSALIGERDENTDSVTIGELGARTFQRSVRRVPILGPEQIRTLPHGTGLILLRSAPPLITRLRPWTTRRDAPTLALERAHVEEALRQAPA